MWLEGGKLHAANTDTYGYMTYLEHACARTGKRTTLPVCDPRRRRRGARDRLRLLEAGVDEVRVFNRTRARAEALAEQFGPRVKAFDWARAQRRRRARPRVLVNTTTVGMNGAGILDIDFHGFDPTASSPTSSTCRWRPS